MNKLTLVYESSIRNNGTAVLMWDAAKRGLGLGDKVQRLTRPILEQDEKLLEGSDLVLMIDDGRDDIPWTRPKVDCPVAYYAIDTHLGFPERLKKARECDYVFCAQKNGAERMAHEGIEKAYWVPLACHPTANPNFQELMAHAERDKWEKMGGLTKMHDIAFVGFINEGAGPGSHNRLDTLDALFREFPNSWITTNCFFEDMAYRFVRARVGANVSIRDDINMRFFEVMSTGTCLLSNTDVSGMDDIGFKAGEHFIGYDGTKEDMIKQARWALENPLEREKIAAAGHQLVRSHHTYVHRLIDIFDTCNVSWKEAA